jgi:hypothetical protein
MGAAKSLEILSLYQYIGVIPEDWKLALLSYLSTFSCSIIFVSSFCFYIFLPFISLVSACVLNPLLSFFLAACCRTCRPNPVVSDRYKEPDSGVRCPLPVCYSCVQDKRVHIACRRLLILLSNYFNLLKTKRNPLYIKHQSVPRCKHFPPRL